MALYAGVWRQLKPQWRTPEQGRRKSQWREDKPPSANASRFQRRCARHFSTSADRRFVEDLLSKRDPRNNQCQCVENRTAGSWIRKAPPAETMAPHHGAECQKSPSLLKPVPESGARRLQTKEGCRFTGGENQNPTLRWAAFYASIKQKGRQPVRNQHYYHLSLQSGA